MHTLSVSNFQVEMHNENKKKKAIKVEDPVGRVRSFPTPGLMAVQNGSRTILIMALTIGLLSWAF